MLNLTEHRRQRAHSVRPSLVIQTARHALHSIMLAACPAPEPWLEAARDLARSQAAEVRSERGVGSATLTMVTWNCQLLWPQAGALNFRATCIADRVLALSPDLVCLQARARAQTADVLSEVTSVEHVGGEAAAGVRALVLPSRVREMRAAPGQ